MPAHGKVQVTFQCSVKKEQQEERLAWSVESKVQGAKCDKAGRCQKLEGHIECTGKVLGTQQLRNATK